MAFDAKKELVAFYERHFDKLVDLCLEVSSKKYRLSPLNSLPLEERRQWVSVGLREIIRLTVFDGEDGDSRSVGTISDRVYFPRVTEQSDAPFFGMADVLDSCECALQPDEAILPLMWQDYANEPEELLALVLEFRKAQNNIIKLQMNNQIKDYENFVSMVRRLAAKEERERVESSLFQRFYLALRSLREKTDELYALVGTKADREFLAAEITQLKMMEVDLLAEVFRLSSDIGVVSAQLPVPLSNSSFEQAAKDAGLTEREYEVAALVARGYGNKAIAERLSLAESTVKNSLSSIIAKLGCENRTQVVVFAAENGYFEEAVCEPIGESYVN